MVLGKMGALQACRTYCSPGCKIALTVHVSRLGEYVMFQVKFKNKQTRKGRMEVTELQNYSENPCGPLVMEFLISYHKELNYMFHDSMITWDYQFPPFSRDVEQWPLQKVSYNLHSACKGSFTSIFSSC